MLSSVTKFIQVSFLWQVAFQNHSVHSARVKRSRAAIQQSKNVSSCDAPEVAGFMKSCSSRCKARVMTQFIKESNVSIFDACGLACDASPKCACFQVAHGRCRIGISSSSDTRKGKAIAYSRTKNLVELPAVASLAEELPVPCRSQQTVKKAHNCTTYFMCKGSGWVEAVCPEGLAFNSKRKTCDWPTAVQGCKDHTLADLSTLTCRAQNFVVAPNANESGETSDGADGAVQTWLKAEVMNWSVAASGMPSIRPEGVAAVSILRVVNMDVSSNKGMDDSYKRWAVFKPPSKTNGPVMQAVALVHQSQNMVDIMGIVSRRSLLDDESAVPGSGKALLGAILSAIHQQFPDKPVVLHGTPGDKFVERLYRKHGMMEIGRHETGMPELSMEIPAKCVDFLVRAILCRDTKVADYMSMAWSVIPGSSYLKRTCAHVMPRRLYLEEIMKMLGAAH